MVQVLHAECLSGSWGHGGSWGLDFRLSSFIGENGARSPQKCFCLCSSPLTLSHTDPPHAEDLQGSPEVTAAFRDFSLTCLFLGFRVGVDPDQDQQPCVDSFQVLQGVRPPTRVTFVCLFSS